MDVTSELRDLAELPSDPGRPIASLYLDTRWNDEQQRRRVLLFAHERCRDALAGRDAGDRSAHETLAWVDARVAALVESHDQTAGVALFASGPRGLWKELESHLPFEPSFAFGPEPLLLPLLRLAEARGPLVVAVVDHRRAVLHVTELGELRSRVELRFEYPGPRRRNEWFHNRFHKLVGRQRRQNKLGAARAIEEVCARTVGARLVLAGSPDQLSALRAELPEWLRERLLPDLHRRHDAPESETLQLALASLRDAGGAEAFRLAERAVDLALAGSSAALGPADVTLAVLEGRVQALFLDDGLRLPGWHCKHCDAIGTHAEAGCPYCGGPAETRDLAPELARRVLHEGGEVHVLGAGGRFQHYSGVAATLRPRGARPRLGEIVREASTVSDAG